MEFVSAAQAIDWINGSRYAGAKDGLNNMRALLDALGNPQKKLRCVHVAGTNGKGSTCAMVERMLRSVGLRTGLYTSPYLMRFHERMRVCGAPIPDEALLRVASDVRRAAEALLLRGVKPTTFELGTAVAFSWFCEQAVDVAVVEVGLGGRLDSTNVIEPELCLIAPIGMDHMRLLGSTLPQIAMEKAGIIKPGVPVAVARQAEGICALFERVSAERGAPFTDAAARPFELLNIAAQGSEFFFDGLRARICLAGRHQIDNACLALSGLRILKERGWPIDWEAALSGLARAIWPGRLEWLDEGLLIDGAHNGHGAAALARYAGEFLAGRQLVLLVGMMREKDVEECASLYARIANRAVATAVDYPRAMAAPVLAQALRGAGMEATSRVPVMEALAAARALAGSKGAVVACGSLYLVGELRLALRDDGGAI